jgi:hypothetical protein
MARISRALGPTDRTRPELREAAVGTVRVSGLLPMTAAEPAPEPETERAPAPRAKSRRPAGRA